MEPEVTIKRRKSRQIHVGSVPVGGDAPISVQSMTNTDTCDVDATVAQIRALEGVGADIVRVSVPTMDAAEAFGKIRKQVSLPLVADIHYDYKIALKVADEGADCLRINPGNIGREDRVRAVIESARDHGVPIRIGVNAGSLEKELQRKYGEPTSDALVESALRHAEILGGPGRAADGRHRRHHPCVPGRRPGGGNPRRLRHSEKSEPAQERREHHRLPELLAAELRRDQDR
jgi:(E)-4-hydroxy-3-methylbut-2-enyl-diphosphate synthase